MGLCITDIILLWGFHLTNIIIDGFPYNFLFIVGVSDHRRSLILCDCNLYVIIY